MRICIRPQTASLPYIFRIILYWNQVRFQDHLVLENSPGSNESRIVESGARRLLRIRHWNQAHPAARSTPPKHRVLAAEIRSSGMPAQTNLLANVLSGESPTIHPFRVAARKPSSQSIEFRFWIYYKQRRTSGAYGASSRTTVGGKTQVFSTPNKPTKVAPPLLRLRQQWL